MKTLVWSWFAVAIWGVFVSFWGLLYPLASLALLFPLFLGLSIVIENVKQYFSLVTIEKGLVVMLVSIWLLHLSGVFVPETGFDALWYHLPVADAMSRAHGLVVLPDLYQSLNPLFSDILFVLGYQVLGALGAKLVAFGLALTLIGLSYEVARLFLNRFWALLTLLVISLFQVVSWQASSFYVDVAKALWELAMMYYLLLWSQNTEAKGHLLRVGLLLGASLATKLFSIVLVPVICLLLLLSAVSKSLGYWLKAVMIVTVTAFVIAVPFYIRTSKITGDPFYSLSLHTDKIAQISASQAPSLVQHVEARILAIWTLPAVLLTSRDYTTPLLLLWLPILVTVLLQHRGDTKLLILFVFSFAQLGLWWFLPPVSSRYALSGFITLFILEQWSVAELVKVHRQYTTPIMMTLVIVVVFQLLPRIVVVHRNLPYILGRESESEYLVRFKDGWIDHHLDAWYSSH